MEAFGIGVLLIPIAKRELSLFQTLQALRCQQRGAYAFPVFIRALVKPVPCAA
jgi:hypothetical protein